MKRFLATVLAGCLALQTLSSYGLTARGAESEIALAEDSISVVAESSMPAENVGQDNVVPEVVVQPEVFAAPASDETGNFSAETPAGAESAADPAPQEGAVTETPMDPGSAGDLSGTPSAEWSQPDALAGEGLSGDALTVDDGLIFEDIEILNEVTGNGPEPGIESGLESVGESESESESESEQDIEIETETGATQERLVFSENAWSGPYIEVKVISTTPACTPGTVTVALEGASHAEGSHQESHVEPVTLDFSDGSNSKTAKIKVAAGTYTLTVKADKFADFVQKEITVAANETAKLEICTTRMPGTNKAQRGWLRLGNVDENGDVTQEDLDAIMKAIRSGSTDQKYNLNSNYGDKIDLVDLQLAVQSFHRTQSATVETLSVPKQVTADDQTVVGSGESGGVGNLMFEGGTTSLKRADESTITPDNPVSMTFSFAEENPDGTGPSMDELPKLEGMTIQPPKYEKAEDDNSIKNAVAEVEYIGADNKSHIMEIVIDDGNGDPSGSQDQGQAGSQGELQSIMLMTVGADSLAAPEDVLVLDEVLAEPEDVLPAEEPIADAAEETPMIGAGIADTAEEIPVTDQGISDTAEPADVTSEVIDDEIGVVIEEEYAGEPESLPAPVDEPESEPDRQKGGTVEHAADGSLVLNFGEQIAVKRVKIKITGTRNNSALAEIAKVEFVNDMESKIPEPELSIPELDEPVVRNEEFDIDWNDEKLTNVTGYEVEISGKVKKTDVVQTQIVRVSRPPHTVTSINDYPLMNFTPYSVKVRSVNGEWTSGWSNVREVKPHPTAKPEPVDNVTTTGGYQSIRVSWKDMDDASAYMVFYALVDEAGAEGEHIPVISNYESLEEKDLLTNNSYTITGLPDNTTYHVYVRGWNSLGWGDESLGSVVTTESGAVPQLPNFRLINTPNGSGAVSAHIDLAACGNHGGQHMVNSAIDDAKKSEKPPYADSQWAYGVVDNDYSSYWIKENDWDDGVGVPLNNYSKGVTITFKDDAGEDGKQGFDMNYLTFTAADYQGTVQTARVVYWNDETGYDGPGKDVGCSVIRRQDVNNRPYYLIRFYEKIRAHRIQLCIGTASSRIDLKIGEMHFHAYDTLDAEIEALFSDEMHSNLRMEDPAKNVTAVTQQEIDALRERVNTPVDGEEHPLKDFLLLDLKAAEELLNQWKDVETFIVDTSITARKDGHINFGGLNEWQPLGKVAAAGDSINVYVGHNGRKTGDSTDLRLYFTQYHAQSNTLSNYYSLKVGPNPITLTGPSKDDFERGGQLYIAYLGNNALDKYSVRIQGASSIPVLNVYGTDSSERRARIEKYIAELQKYVGTVEAAHNELHAGSANSNVNKYSYGEGKNCVLNATDLMMDYMMYSVPATQVWSALNQSGASDKATWLNNSLAAMEKTMQLFYQHKGLMKGAGGDRETPSRHLNIRYMRMFAGAFMYASGNHIGIEWPETTCVAAASWNSFGWGIAHEIGHDINDPRYAVAEITNNYFAQLLTGAYNGTRFDFKDVYKKVTSGSVGRSPNGAVQLALYWQLHLAYDNYTAGQGQNGHTDDRYIFDNYQDMFDNLFFARVDTYSRHPDRARKNNVELKFGSDVDQNLMRLACAAAKANILPFFERWGMVPDADTETYAKAWGEKTQKALYYVNESARDYRVAHPGEDQNVFAGGTVTASVDRVDQNRVSLTMRTAGAQTGSVLGYEIIRGMTTKGTTSEEVIGFAEADGSGNASYTDTIASIDNRVLTYSVKAVDKFLNYSEVTEAGSAKVATGGALSKDSWTVETTMTSTDDTAIVPDHEDPDAGYDPTGNAERKTQSIYRIIDNVKADNGEEHHVYNGSSNGNEQIIVDMQKVTEVTSIYYMGTPLDSISISVSTDKSTWIPAKENYTGLKNSGCETEFKTIWLDSVLQSEKDKWIGTYDARYVRFEIPQSGAIKINEIDICGPSGDNVEFLKSGDAGQTTCVGIVANDYKYAEGTDAEGNAYVIPKDALIFMGTYKGNPAYNVVMLYDAEGNVVGAHKAGSGGSGDENGYEVDAEMVILAPDPKDGNLGNVSDGYWVYYVRTGNWSQETYEALGGKVRAELMRVDNALTLAGDRVVSDTNFVDLPAYGALQKITLTDEINKKNAEPAGPTA